MTRVALNFSRCLCKSVRHPSIRYSQANSYLQQRPIAPTIIIGSKFFSTQPVSGNDPDDLYKSIEVELKGHDKAVLSSYQTFVEETSKHLELELSEVETPPKYTYRRTLLKSAHVHKKHRVQYEIHTHYKIFKFKHMTGSTASTVLEYLQRNLPEGVAMKVTKHQIEALPEHL